MQDPREQVLIVDDEPASREALCALLTTEGYTASLARDGAEALARLRESPIPLVICEFTTPRLGALDLLRALVGLALQVDVHELTSPGGRP